MIIPSFRFISDVVTITRRKTGKDEALAAVPSADILGQDDRPSPFRGGFSDLLSSAVVARILMAIPAI